MPDYKQLKCPVCNLQFDENDDIVVCPICGAPHHKACYMLENKCFFESTHGTSEQWHFPEPEAPKLNADGFGNLNGENKNRFEGGMFGGEGFSFGKDVPLCKNCGKPLVHNAPFCPFCGEPVSDENEGQFDENAPFVKIHTINGPYNVPNDSLNGIKCIDIVRFVGVNFERYLKIFTKFIKGGKTISWNWLAFLVPNLWAFSRKCYKTGILFSAYEILITVLFYLSGITEKVANESFDVYTFAQTKGAYILFALSTIYIVLHFVFGLFADKIYQKYVFSSIREMKENKSPVQEFAKRGGVSLLSPAIAYVACDIISSVIVYLVG